MQIDGTTAFETNLAGGHGGEMSLKCDAKQICLTDPPIYHSHKNATCTLVCMSVDFLYRETAVKLNADSCRALKQCHELVAKGAPG